MYLNMYYIYFTRFRPLILSVLRRIPYSLPGLPNDEVDTIITNITIISIMFTTVIIFTSITITKLIDGGEAHAINMLKCG